jgi:hypothetical protein
MIKAKIYLQYLSLLFTLAAWYGCSAPSSNDLNFPETSQTTKPWTRWWWHGSSVTPEGITAELEALQRAGIGGVEITPIYGVRGEEADFVDYLSEDWVALLRYTLREADRLGLGVDMATGTGWPFGGPWVSADQASKNIALRRYTLTGGEQLDEKVSLVQEPLLRTVRPIEETLSDIIDPIAENTDLQVLAIDQVRFPRQLPLQVLMAYSDQGAVLDLTTKVETDGTLDWTAPAGDWQLYALFQGWHGKMVERAAPGGEGKVIDHFSKAATTHYLAAFAQALAGEDLSGLRAFFNDSYEVDDARGQADWTPDLLAVFAERRGYDLREHLPALLAEDGGDQHRRVLSDYRETMGELLLEHFTRTWADWARESGTIVRNQAHGSPANILDLYAAVDIPETEGKDIIKAKMASSAAHVSGKKWASAEAATWLGEHFTTNLADLKQNIDQYFAAGINHVFYHGTCYSPPDAEWPGRLFYAAIHANPRNPLWEDYPAFNQYVSRTQAFLQSGRPDNEVLLYFPAYDRLARSGGELLEHFDGWATPRRGDTTAVRKTAEWLQAQGYGFDFISDRQLLAVDYAQNELSVGGVSYATIVVPPTAFMPLTTLEKLVDLQAAGATICFQQWPESVPGWKDWSLRQATFEELLMEVQTSGVEAQPDLEIALTTAGVLPEPMAALGVDYHRRSDGAHHLYFVSNWSGQSIDEWVPLRVAAASVAFFDPMSSRKGLAQTRLSKGTLEVRLQLNPGESLILKTFSKKTTREPWPYRPKDLDFISLEGDWQLTFVKGGPVLPESQALEQPQYWTALEGAAYQQFSGTAVYATNFTKPAGLSRGILLDLGKVSESASVKLNGVKVGTVIGPVYQLFIPADQLSEDNMLEIAVTNGMANRIIYLEQSGKRWQRFYNINVSANKRENIGTDGVFTTMGWSVVPSGLAGPVRIAVVQEEAL